MEHHVVLFGQGLKKEEELREHGAIGLPSYSGPYSSFNRENPRDQRIIELVSNANLGQHERILESRLLINENELKKIVPSKFYRVYAL